MSTTHTALPPGAVIARTQFDVDWLPKPNRVDLILSDDEAPEDLTRTAFMVPYLDTWAVVLAHNTRRGIEMAGGHIEAGEGMLDAALRELREETGVDDVRDPEPLGYLRMFCAGDKPEGHYPYPFPLSYQQIYTGRAMSLGVFEPTDECHAPLVTSSLSDPRITRETVRVYAAAARLRALDMV
ncbi:8-oxo-dGTP diphosphatase [Brevundimonas phage vB_BpoS-Bambus]|nr:8-oxo-dGTP diphosphatase [Brevundimonas phage vB_BpoS-Bambus]